MSEDEQVVEQEVMLDKPSWTVRRRLVYASLAFCAINIQWIIIKGTDSALYSQLGLGLLGAAVTILGSYIFGASFSDQKFNEVLAAAQMGGRGGMGMGMGSSYGYGRTMVSQPTSPTPAATLNPVVVKQKVVLPKEKATSPDPTTTPPVDYGS